LGGGYHPLRPVHLFLVALSALSGASVLLAQPTITEYTLPTADSVPQAIAKGPDGNLWIIETSANKIAKVTPSGVVTEYPILTANSGATGITGGPDGNVWFTETSANKIGKITPDGVITEFPLPAVSSRPTSITAGLDGNIWFIEGMGIGRMTTDGSVIQFPFAVSSTSQITGGSDGNVWFTLTDSDEVAKITPSGEISRHPLLTTKPAGIRLFPRSITQGPDGNLWVAGGGLVWRISAAGIAVPYAVPQVENIAVGPDGNLWFTEPIRSRIARLKSDGTVTEYSGPLAGSITAGPDGNIWFTVPESGKVGKLVVSTAPLDNTLTLSQNSLTFNGSVFGGPPAAQTITVTASQSVSYTASVRLLYSPPWLAISPSGTLNGNQTITVTVNQANMGTQGAHFGFIQLAVGDTTQTVLVTLNLTAAGSGGDIKVSPGALDFSYATQTSAPSPQQILITNVNLLSSIPLIVSYTSVLSKSDPVGLG
jgi:streptogramin lyase